jgi:membrane-associated protein
MDTIIDLFRTLFNAERLQDLLTNTLTGWASYAVLWAIIFSETGLLVGFLLPGDSLLFIVGMVAGLGKLNIVLINILLISAAVIGDAVGYQLGKRAGPPIFNRPDSRWFKQEHLRKTQAYYEKHGGKTIIYARFVPIIRTFAPFVAGVAQMSYSRFLSFNIFGGIGWVMSLTLLGYFIGDQEIVRKNLEKVILAIILISVAPVVIEAWRSRQQA